MRKIFRKGLWLLASLIALAVIDQILVGSLGTAVRREVTPPVVPEIWAHRGDHRNATANSLAAFRDAVSHGYRGIEIDVHFDAGRDEFLVGHDAPESTDVYPSLRDVLLEIDGYDGTLWLDLKNLAARNEQGVVARLKALDREFGIAARTLVESPRIRGLRGIEAHGFRTLYWVQYRRLPWLSSLQVLRLRRVLERGGYAGVSLREDLLRQRGVAGLVRGLPLYVFTVDDESAYRELEARGDVQVVLTDRLAPGAPGQPRGAGPAAERRQSGDGS